MDIINWQQDTVASAHLTKLGSSELTPIWAETPVQALRKQASKGDEHLERFWMRAKLGGKNAITKVCIGSGYGKKG